MGLLKFTPSAWNKVIDLRGKLQKSESDSMSMTELLNLLIRCKTKILAIPYNGAWGEIDRQSDLQCY